MTNNLKQFVFEFNNLCRKDSRIKEWAVYLEEPFGMMVDINFVDFNNKVYDYHHREEESIIDYMHSKEEIKKYATYVFEDLQLYFQRKEFAEVKDE